MQGYCTFDTPFLLSNFTIVKSLRYVSHYLTDHMGFHSPPSGHLLIKITTPCKTANYHSLVRISRIKWFNWTFLWTGYFAIHVTSISSFLQNYFSSNYMNFVQEYPVKEGFKPSFSCKTAYPLHLTVTVGYCKLQIAPNSCSSSFV